MKMKDKKGGVKRVKGKELKGTGKHDKTFFCRYH